MAVPKPPFKTCGACRTDWADGRSFILDPGVRLLGLQAVPAQPDANVLVFEHRCGSSISTFASGLRYLLGNEEPEHDLPHLFGTEACQGHCRSIADLEGCDRRCSNARDRRLTVLIADAKRGLATLA